MTIWRLHVDDAATGEYDVVVEGASDSQSSDLARALIAAGIGAENPAVGGWGLGHGRTLSDLQMSHGDTITGGKQSPEAPARVPGTYLVVVAGIDAGAFIRLEDREMLAGRVPTADLRLQDPLVGRRHVQVEKHAGDEPGVRVTDLDSKSGTLVEGHRIATPTIVVPGQLVQCGATLLGVEVIKERDLPPLATVDGATRPFARHFRAALPPLTERMRAPGAEDNEDELPKPGWWRSLVPLVSGGLLAWYTGRWEYLFIMALGPIVLVVEARRMRRAQTTRDKRRKAKVAAQVAGHEAQMAANLATEQRRRRQVAPGAGASVVHAELRSHLLWARIPEDEDFAAVTIGFAGLPSSLKVEAATGESSASELWRIPVSISLPQTGSLAVLGAPHRSRAVARGLILSLAVNHSPSDVRIWVLSDAERAPQWAFARWLPHAFLDGGGARIAASDDERSELLKFLNQIVETRRDQGSKGSTGQALHLPLDVVVLDWPGTTSSDDVATLLSKGAPYGVVGVAIEVDSVLEGVRATLRLSQYSDEASFESRLLPKVDGVGVAEISNDLAMRAARAMSGLRPAATEAASESGELRLTELLGLTEMTGPALERRWQQRSPRTAELIGRASGAPMVVDIVHNGPHGLVGGTTRSGKTEFLKTLFAALMLDNSPDDLSILIVDFKGGVDHAAFARVPHVISLSTNADVDRFTRTIKLLVSEQNRRQDHFREHDVANLEAYRAVRKDNPALAAIPRLLVVVDEFGELQSSEIGKEHLRTLESVTRIGGGLGLHLLLVTQTFAQLPLQVAANTGLRICFRVETANDSKIILEGGAAASIPHGRPGRAVARFHRGDLVEFQTARVAGRRKELNAGPPPVKVVLAPLGTLARFTVAVEKKEVPVKDSDLGAIIAAVRDAATGSGWIGSAIPWPEELPRRVPLASMLAKCGDDEVPLGLADVPERQRREVVTVGDDEQLLLVGGSRSGVGEALLTLVTAAMVRRGAAALHVHAIDLADGVLAPAGALPGVGSVAVRNESLSLKIVRHLLDVTADRRALFATHGVSSLSDLNARGMHLPTVVLALHGADRLLAREENAATPLTAAVLRLMVESPGTGVHLWITGTAAVGYHRFGTAIARRIVMQVPNKQDFHELGVPRWMGTELDGPGRAYDVVSGRLFQFASVSDDPKVPAGDVVRAVGHSLGGATSGTTQREGPKRIVDIGWPLPFERLDRGALLPPEDYAAAFPIGVDTASGDWAWLDSQEDGPVVVIGGRSKSGRSSALLAIADMARPLGWDVIGLPASRRSRLWRPDAALNHVIEVEPTHPPHLDALRRPTLILIDDAHRLQMDDLGLKTALDSDQPIAIIAAGALDALSRRTGFLKTLPPVRTAILLAPTAASDAMPFGLSRVPDTALTDGRAGRGIVVSNGEWHELQVPYRREWDRP